MKTNLFLLMMSLFISSCMAQKPFNPKTDPVAKIQGEEIVMIADEATITSSVKAARPEVKEVLNIRVEKENEFSYLLFEIKTNELTIPYAVQLIPKEAGSKLLLATGTTNSCAGHCCESCVFTKNGSGEITCCWCQRAAATPGCQTEARCDHSVSTSSAGIMD